MRYVVIVQQTIAAMAQPIEEISLSDTGPEAKLREHGSEFMPKFDDRGLLTAIVTEAVSKDILMVAYMNERALEQTIATGKAHFWSRSRESQWMKGETSGNVLHVERMRVDCDQDAIILECSPAGPACHTGTRSCFYRELKDGHLETSLS